jgi:RHS repeat-associated protein
MSTAKERDDESGLDYFGARYYASSLGRFARPDPLLGETGNSLEFCFVELALYPMGAC